MRRGRWFRRGRREGKNSADATQSELSVVNEPGCLRDKEDKSMGVRDCACLCVLSSAPLKE